jgi:glutathione S-transferase
MRTLIVESFSPWSEKARWALDHHRVAYASREHYPLIGELSLRLRARRLAGAVSTPLLLTPEGALIDSFVIARYAEHQGDGAALFPPEHEAAVVAWNARSEAALRALRVSFIERLGRSREAKVELQPHYFPGFVRRLSAPATDVALAFLRRKYGMADRAAAEVSLLQELEGLRQALQGGQHYLVGDRFSFADIAMAVTLQFVSPVEDRYLALGPATRAASHHPQLAARFPELLAWRDLLYARHRHSERR